jgi:hypothetical protein
LEGVSPEVERLWLSHVKEARPVYMHGWRIATLVVALPITGAIGWGVLTWWRWGDADLRRRVIGAALPGIAASLLLLWQTRTGPAAQMMAAVGAAALIWIFFPKIWSSSSAVVRVGGGSLVLLAGSSALIPAIVGSIPPTATGARDGQVSQADKRCGSLLGLHDVALQPKGLIITTVDLGPRLITVTHHDTIAGPYHRNGQQIADVLHFWRGSAEQAHALVRKYHAGYVLSCPDSSETTIFMAETPQGFYAQLERGQVPSWLAPVKLSPNAPYKMWKVVRTR